MKKLLLRYQILHTKITNGNAEELYEQELQDELGDIAEGNE